MNRVRVYIYTYLNNLWAVSLMMAVSLILWAVSLMREKKKIFNYNCV